MRWDGLGRECPRSIDLLALGRGAQGRSTCLRWAGGAQARTTRLRWDGFGAGVPKLDRSGLISDLVTPAPNPCGRAWWRLGGGLLLWWVGGGLGGPLTGGWSGFRVWLLRWWVAGRAGLGGGSWGQNRAGCGQLGAAGRLVALGAHPSDGRHRHHRAAGRPQSYRLVVPIPADSPAPPSSATAGRGLHDPASPRSGQQARRCGRVSGSLGCVKK